MEQGTTRLIYWMPNLKKMGLYVSALSSLTFCHKNVTKAYNFGALGIS
jgi:hypothetical protein